MKRSVLKVAAVMMLASCGNGGTTAPAAVHGTFNGKALNAQDAYSFRIVFGSNIRTYVVITDYANACNLENTNARKPNTSALSFSLSSSALLDAGTLSLGGTGDPAFETAYYTGFDSSCNASLNESAATGSVTLTNLDASTVDGTFDLGMAGGDHATGTFNAINCPYQAGTDAGAFTCN